MMQRNAAWPVLKSEIPGAQTPCSRARYRLPNNSAEIRERQTKATEYKTKLPQREPRITQDLAPVLGKHAITI